MSHRTLLNIARDEWILRLLQTPLTSVEISDLMFREVREAWAEREGVAVTWGSDEWPPIAKLLAFCEAKDDGLAPLQYWDVYRRLLVLERRGEVARIQVDGARLILWRRAENFTPNSQSESEK